MLTDALKIITLKRIAQKAEGTYGVLMDEGTPFCLTHELPWLNNERNKSCIPVGEYTCKKINTEHYGDVFQVMDVPNRTDILIHKGNFSTDTLGCILLGESFAEILNPKLNKIETAVASTGEAYTEFMKIRLIGQSAFKLVILET